MAFQASLSTSTELSCAHSRTVGSERTFVFIPPLIATVRSERIDCRNGVSCAPHTGRPPRHGDPAQCAVEFRKAPILSGGTAEFNGFR